MPTFLRMFVFWLCALAATAVVAAYPDRPVHLIVPFAAGGPSDAAARVLAQSIAKTLAQPVVVENKPGANGALAVQSLLNAAPDGYTLLWGTASMVAIPLLQKAPTESLADLAPVSSVGQFLFCLFLNPQVPAATLSEFIAYARWRPALVRQRKADCACWDALRRAAAPPCPTYPRSPNPGSPVSPCRRGSRCSRHRRRQPTSSAAFRRRSGAPRSTPSFGLSTSDRTSWRARRRPSSFAR